MADLSRTMIIEKHARKITRLEQLFEAVKDFPRRTLAVEGIGPSRSTNHAAEIPLPSPDCS